MLLSVTFPPWPSPPPRLSSGPSQTPHLYAIGSPRGAAIFQFSNLAVSPTEVTPGEEVQAQAEVANRGDAPGTVVAELQVDGLVRDQKEITLKPGQATLISYSFSFPAAEIGPHQVTIDGLPPVEVTVPG